MADNPQQAHCEDRVENEQSNTLFFSCSHIADTAMNRQKANRMVRTETSESKTKILSPTREQLESVGKIPEGAQQVGKTGSVPELSVTRA